MPDISHKDAGFVVLVAVLIFVVLIFWGIVRVGRYLDSKKPKGLSALVDTVNTDHEEGRFDQALSALLTYLKLVEANPMQHMEFGPVFTLIAKTYLRKNLNAESYYFSNIAEHYYGLFDIAIEQGNDQAVLIGNLRNENKKTEAQAAILIADDQRAQISTKINGHHANGDVRSTADWVRLQPIS